MAYLTSINTHLKDKLDSMWSYRNTLR